MNKHLFRKAKELAQRPYQVHIVSDETTDGKPAYFARVSEMPGCVSHGYTIEEARSQIETAKVDFIYFLLEDELPIPKPRLLNTRMILNMGDYIDTNVSESTDVRAPFLHA